MPNRTLSGRLLRPMAVAVVVLTMLVVLAGVYAMRRAVGARARDRVATLAPAVQAQIERLMLEHNHGHLQRLVENIGRTPDVEAVRVIDPSGRVRASSRPGELGQRFSDHLGQADPRGDYLPGASRIARWPGAGVHTVRPFVNKPECQGCHDAARPTIGWLDVDLAVSEHSAGLAAFGTLSLLLGTAYFVAVVGIAGSTLRFIVVKPLRRLAAAQAAVEAGNLHVAVERTGTREIDSAFDGFNHMVARLRQGRAAEQEAQRLQMERVEQLASVGQLAAGLAHEFRNPLSSVRAVLEVVADEPGRVESRQILRDAAGELDRLDQIVRDLLQYARPRAPAIAVFDLNALVREVCEFTLSRAIACGAAVHLELAPDVPPVMGDADMVRQVLVNLLLNAHQAAPPAGAEITLVTGHDPQRAWCRVRDNGPGVPADQAVTVFRPFVTTKSRGTGLGLSISRRIMELQGGILSLDNAGEAGASFTFTLPLAAAARDPQADVQPQDPDR